VEGGPGTGKTAVALHRAAYLLYQDRRRYAGGILIVSPTPLLVSYTEGVLPSLGEEGQVAIRALGALAEETAGAVATTYDEQRVARIKGSARMVKVLRKAARGALDVGLRAPVPDRLRVVAFGNRVELDAAELDAVRQQVLGGTAPVNLMRPRARRLLLDALWEKAGARRRYDDPELAAEARAGFDEDVATEEEFLAFLDAWWPELTPRQVLGAMTDESRLARWSRRVLRPQEARTLARALAARLGPAGEGELSVHDIALLDELRSLLGAPARPRKREADPLDQLTGLEELTTAADRDPGARREAGGWRAASERTEYAHVIVDEAQDLSPMQWRMVGRRGRHATWTIVGDPAQSSWTDPDEAEAARDEALGKRPRRRFELTVNYRNPAELARLADRVLALAMPGVTPPRAVRSTGVRPGFTVAGDDLGASVRAAASRLLDEVEGTVGVVVAMARREEAREWLAGLGERVVALGSLEAKGLEYDATLVVSPAQIADESPAGLRTLYVALTRATQRLEVLGTAADLPDEEGVPDLLRP
ncbi:HelD family protein, partial [Streptomyces albus]